MKESTTLLKEVGQRALTDKQFFYALVQNVDDALSQAGMKLTPEDLTTLKTALSQPTPGGFDLKAFLERLHSGQNPFLHWDTDWLRPFLPKE